MCILSVRVKINKRSFEPFCVWILISTSLHFACDATGEALITCCTAHGRKGWTVQTSCIDFCRIAAGTKTHLLLVKIAPCTKFMYTWFDYLAVSGISCFLGSSCPGMSSGICHLDVIWYVVFVMGTYLFICLSIYLSIYLSVYLSIYLSICLSIYLSIYLSVYLSICLSIYLSIYLSVCLSVCLSIYLSICLSVFLSIYFTHGNVL